MQSFAAWTLAVLLLIVSGMLGFVLSLYTHKNPVNENEVQSIEVLHYPTLFVDQLRGDPQAGKKIYKEYCASCHAQNPVLELKAPHIGNENEWRQWRQRKDLLQRTIRGVGAMPARGGCFECSDEQLQQAINYMFAK
jgi:cytochrome c5